MIDFMRKFVDKKKLLSLLAALLILLGAAACGASGQDQAAGQAAGLPEQDGYYYDLESVVLYLEAYDELPPNYITKAEAQALGWRGGSVEKYREGAAIGGDRFGNREGLLPQDTKYTECDLNTQGADERGAERLVFSDEDERSYYYTGDHYESFQQVVVEDGQVLIEADESEAAA